MRKRHLKWLSHLAMDLMYQRAFIDKVNWLYAMLDTALAVSIDHFAHHVDVALHVKAPEFDQ
ncbi:MAG: hypothetical protein AAF590_09535 [Pseudomonadota bacterium]